MQTATPEKGSFPASHQGIGAEMAVMLRRGREVWRLVPCEHKWALAGAVRIMVFTSACSTALFALIAAIYKAPVLGLVMLGVIPVTIFLTIRRLLSQKEIRLQLMRSCEEIDGAVVGDLGGIEYVRAADTMQLQMNRLARRRDRQRSVEARQSGKVQNGHRLHPLLHLRGPCQKSFDVLPNNHH